MPPWNKYSGQPKQEGGSPWAKYGGATNAFSDVVNAFKTGVNQGVTGLAGTVSQARPGANMLDTAVGMADDIENVGRLLTGKKPKERERFSSANVPGLKTAMTGAPAAEDLKRVTTRLSGPDYKPQTTAGRYAQSIGQMTPAVAAPGSMAARAVNVFAPGIAAQAAADTTKALGGDERAQEMARLAGAAGGGILAQVRVPSASSLPPLPARVLTPQQRNIQTLREAGVSLTPGQRAGGQLKNAEDLAARAPVLGAAIKGARARGVESLNRAVGHRALEPLGEGVPAKVHTGHDSVKYVAERLGKAYDDAADMVPATALDDAYGAGVSAIRNGLREQPETVGQQFDNIVANRLSHLTNGPVSGRQVRAAQSDINRLAAEFSASDDSAQRALGGALDDLQSQLGEVIGRASPEAAALIGKANQGWSIYARMRNAASKAKGGIFTPGQLNTAVRVSDRSVGKGNVAKGEAVLQDLSNAAWEVLPDAYGNPGSADALSAFGLATAMVAPQTAGAAIPAAVGLTAAATPYAAMARRTSSGLPAAGSVEEARQLERFIRQARAARLRSPEFLGVSAGAPVTTQQSMPRGR